MVINTRTLLGVALLGAGACNWASFDDLRDEVWVERVNKPNASRQYGAAVGGLPVTPQTAANAGANLVVMGRAPVSVSTLRYDDAGKHTTSSVINTALLPGLEFDDFPVKPAFTIDPGEHPDFAGKSTNHRFAFGGLTGNLQAGQGFVAIMSGDLLDDSAAPPRILANPGVTDAIATMRPGGLVFADVPGTAGMTGTFANVAELGDMVVGRGTQIDTLLDYADRSRMTVTFPECTQLNTGDFDTASEVGFADITEGTEIEVIVSMGPEDGNQGVATSEIRIYDIADVVKDGSTVATPGPCEAPKETIPVPAWDGGFALLTTKFDPAATQSDLVYSAPSINTVFVRFAGSVDPIAITVPTTGSNFGYALAAGDLDGDGNPELVVGAPRSDVDGTTDSGAVFVYKVDLTNRTFTLVDGVPLSPSSPTASEQFGKSVTIAPWGTSGQNTLVVGAEGKVFVYFRTSLYDDVRAGR